MQFATHDGEKEEVNNVGAVDMMKRRKREAMGLEADMDTFCFLAFS